MQLKLIGFICIGLFSASAMASEIVDCLYRDQGQTLHIEKTGNKTTLTEAGKGWGPDVTPESDYDVTWESQRVTLTFKHRDLDITFYFDGERVRSGDKLSTSASYEGSGGIIPIRGMECVYSVR